MKPEIPETITDDLFLMENLNGLIDCMKYVYQELKNINYELNAQLKHLVGLQNNVYQQEQTEPKQEEAHQHTWIIMNREGTKAKCNGCGLEESNKDTSGEIELEITQNIDGSVSVTTKNYLRNPEQALAVKERIENALDFYKKHGNLDIDFIKEQNQIMYNKLYNIEDIENDKVKVTAKDQLQEENVASVQQDGRDVANLDSNATEQSNHNTKATKSDSSLLLDKDGNYQPSESWEKEFDEVVENMSDDMGNLHVQASDLKNSISRWIEDAKATETQDSCHLDEDDNWEKDMKDEFEQNIKLRFMYSDKTKDIPALYKDEFLNQIKHFINKWIKEAQRQACPLSKEEVENLIEWGKYIYSLPINLDRPSAPIDLQSKLEDMLKMGGEK